MTRETLLKKAIEHLSKLPEQEILKVSDFAEFLLYRIDNQILSEGVQEMVSSGNAFQFLEEEEDLYCESDLKQRYK